MTLNYCRPPDEPTPVLSGTDYIDRLNFLRLNLFRFSRFTFTGGAFPENPFSAYGAQKKALILPGTGTPEAAMTDRTWGAATVGHNGGAYNFSFYAYIRGGGTSGTVKAGFRDSGGGALSSSGFSDPLISDAADDQTFNVTDVPTLFTWEHVASDDPDFYAAFPSNAQFKFFDVSIDSGSELVITLFQGQLDDFYAPHPISQPWRPAPGEEDLAQYAEYILQTNFTELSLKPGARAVVGPEGRNLQLVPAGPTRFYDIPDDTFTLDKSHDGALLVFSGADGATVTAPAYDDADVPTKAEVFLKRATGAGPVVFEAGAGATLQGPPGCTFTITSEEGEAVLRKIAPTIWQWLDRVGNPTNIGGVTVESGVGAPTRIDRAPGSLYMRTDVSQLWRYSDEVVRSFGVNIVATDLKTGTNIVTLDGYETSAVLRFSKPLAAASGGLLTWDAWSAYPTDAGNGGFTYLDEIDLYGNTGGGDTTLLSMPNVAFATAADAYDAADAVLPVTATGYTTYKIVGTADPNPADNRFGLSVLVEELGGWVLVRDVAVGFAEATEALTAGEVCNYYASSGAKIQKANATDLTKPANCFVLSSFGSGDRVKLYFPGEWITGLSGLTAGATYWLDTTGGAIDTSPPAADAGHGSQIVGYADETGTRLFFCPQPMFGI